MVGLWPESTGVSVICGGLRPSVLTIINMQGHGGWAEGRAKAYGVKVEELPAFYAKRTLLNEIILPEDIANACYAFVGGLLKKSTGNMLNVDGGLAVAFPR